MKKILIALIVSMLMSVTANAGIVEVKAAYKARDYTLCSSEAAKVIADSEAVDYDKAQAQCYIGRCYYIQKDYAKALPEFQKVISDYPTMTNQCASAQRYIGHCYEELKDYAKALTEYQKVISDYPTDSANCAYAQRYIGYCYERLGKVVEMQASYIQLCEIQGAPLILVTSVFSKIDKVALGKVEYLKLIDTMLLVIPATAANAEFLGVLKSEQEKLK